MATTIACACFFTLLAVSRQRGGSALGIVVCSMLLWPEDLRIPLGLVQMSVPRTVALAVLIKFVTQGMIFSVRFSKIDGLVIGIWGWTILANILAGAEFYQISQMIGRGLDTVIIYYVSRLAFYDTDQVKAFVPWLFFTALVMGAIGLYESFTYQSPYRYLAGGGAYEVARMGLLRAIGSTSHAIQFGMAMMIVMVLVWSVRAYASSRSWYIFATSSALLGAFSSMSSGPWLATILVITLQIFYYRPHLIMPSLKLGLLAVVVLEIASNRHFYELIDHLALDSQTAWYRTRLLEVAFQEWRDFWLIGVGSDMPHHWAASIDGRDHVDVVNYFILIALYGGTPALAMFIATHVIAIERTVLSWQECNDERLRKLLFGLASALIALDFASMSVSLFGPPLLLSNILLGCIVGITAWCKDIQGKRVLKEVLVAPAEGPLQNHRYID